MTEQMGVMWTLVVYQDKTELDNWVQKEIANSNSHIVQSGILYQTITEIELTGDSLTTYYHTAKFSKDYTDFGICGLPRMDSIIFVDGSYESDDIMYILSKMRSKAYFIHPLKEAKKVTNG